MSSVQDSPFRNGNNLENPNCVLNVEEFIVAAMSPTIKEDLKLELVRVVFFADEIIKVKDLPEALVVKACTWVSSNIEITHTKHTLFCFKSWLFIFIMFYVSNVAVSEVDAEIADFGRNA